MSATIPISYSSETKSSLILLEAELINVRHHKENHSVTKAADPIAARKLMKALLNTSPSYDADDNPVFNGVVDLETAKEAIPMVVDTVLQYKHMNANTALRNAGMNVLAPPKAQHGLHYGSAGKFHKEEVLEDLARIAQQNGFGDALREPEIDKKTLSLWGRQFKQLTGDDLTPLMTLVRDIVGPGFRPQIIPKQIDPKGPMSRYLEGRGSNQHILDVIKKAGTKAGVTLTQRLDEKPDVGLSP